MTSTINSAIELAKKTGWNVFPINPNTKKPVFAGWQGKACSEPRQIERLFAPYPTAGIGVPTGPINGITVIDIDVKNGVDGFKTIDRLGLQLWTGMVATTPSGGSHFYFRTNQEVYKSTVGEKGIGLGVDVRSIGGFVVAPPTISDRGQYVWQCDLDAASIRLFPLGHELKKKLQGPSSNKQGNRTFRLRPRDLLAPVYEGCRNDEMASRCGYLFAKGLPADDVLVKMLVINNEAFHPPLPEREITTIHRSIMKREVR